MAVKNTILPLVTCHLSLFFFLFLFSPSLVWGFDIGDETFGIFNEEERSAFKEFNISSDLKKADQEASANRFDAAIAICRKLLKNTNLSLADKKKVRGRITAIEGKRSSYLAAKAKEEEERKQVEAGALLEKAGVESAQERQRLLNATGQLTIYVKFQGWIFDYTPTKYEVRVRRSKDVFGEFVSDFERTNSGGSGFFDSISANFYGMKYGLYEVKVTAWLKRASSSKSGSFTAQVVLAKERAYYDMSITDFKSVYIYAR